MHLHPETTPHYPDKITKKYPSPPISNIKSNIKIKAGISEMIIMGGDR